MSAQFNPRDRFITSCSRRPILWVIIVTLFMTLILLASLVSVNRLTNKYAPLQDATMEIKLEAMLAHLWFEEMLSGARAADISSVWNHIELSSGYAQSLLQGGNHSEGTLVPLRDPSLRREIEAVQTKIREFRMITEQRWNERSLSENEQPFDSTFDDLIRQTDGVGTALQMAMEQELHQFKLLQLSLITLNLGFFTLTILSIRYYIRQQSLTLSALQENEEWLRLSTETAGVAIWEYDLVKNHMSRSHNHDSLYGMDPQEIWTIDTFLNAVHPDDRERTTRTIDQSIAGGPNRYHADYRTIWPDQSIHWLSLTGVISKRDSAGTATSIRGCLIDITERKTAEIELRQNQKLLKIVLNASPDLIWMKDPNGVFMMCNSEFEKLAGSTSDQLTGLTDYDVFPQEHADSCRAQDSLALRSQCRQVHEEPMRHATLGINVWYETIKVPVHDANGKLLGVLGVGRDLTERLRAEATLSQNQKLISDVVDALPEMLWLKDTEGKYLLGNQAFRKLVNVQQAELIGLTDYDLFPKEKADFYRKHDRIAIRKKTTSINEESADYDVDGYSIWIEALKTPMYGKEGELIGVLGIGRDISRQREALQASLEKQEFLNQVVDQSPIPMYITSPNGTALRCNQAVRTLWNLSPEQSIIGYTLSNDTNLKTPEIAQKLARARTEKQAVRFELYWDPKKVLNMGIGTANPIWLDISVFPLLNSEKSITNYVVQMMDITTQKKAAADLERHQASLECDVSKRTKELRQIVSAMAGRENRMAELKSIIRQLNRQLEDAALPPQGQNKKISTDSSDPETQNSEGTR